jgi:hypothetical protein
MFKVSSSVKSFVTIFVNVGLREISSSYDIQQSAATIRINGILILLLAQQYSNCRTAAVWRIK